MSSLFIVGGGASLKGFDFSVLKDVPTMCVNASIFNVPNPNFFITMDYSFLNKVEKKFINRSKAIKMFVLNREEPYIVKNKFNEWHDSRFDLVYNLKMFDIVYQSFYNYSPDGLSGDAFEFSHGKHSGFCALQSAYIMGFEDIKLLGFDYKTVDGKTHYHDQYKKSQFASKCEEYKKLFYRAVDYLHTNTDVKVTFV